MDRLKLTLAILTSPDRELIQEYLIAAFGEQDVFRIDSPNLDIFVTEILKKLFPNLHLQF